MNNSQTKLIAENSWRVSVANYAYRASGGQWQKYQWLCFLLLYLQLKIIKGGARIIVNAPPRHGKSEAISHWLPTWYLDWFPQKHVILGCYGNDFAKKWGRAVRNEFDNNPHVRHKLSKDKRDVKEWELEEGGGMRSTSLNGSITGLGGDLNIIDDPHKNFREALSPTKRQTVIDGYKADIRTRLEPNASIIVVQTRWHERDLTGYLLHESLVDWEILNFPAFAEENDTLGRKEGEPLCPNRYDVAALEELKLEIGTFMWAGLFQQRPAPLKGEHVERAWFRHWVTLPEHMDEWLQSWDMNLGGDTGTSYVAGQVWGRKGANYYLVDQFRKKVNFVDLVIGFREMKEKWSQAVTKIVENKAAGPAIISSLKNEIPGIIPNNPKGSKLARLLAVSGAIESGNVFLPPKDIYWVNDLIDEVVTFPNSANDDQVDALSQALDRLIKKKHIGNIALPNLGRQVSPWSIFNG